MPDILIRRTLGALETVNNIFGEGETNWAFRYCPFPRGLYTILAHCTGAAGNTRHTVQIGTQEMVAPSLTSVGATDGIMPTPAGNQAAPAHQFYAGQGDEVRMRLEETGNVATTDVMIWANVEPA
jgi:hypothetical protein